MKRRIVAIALAGVLALGVTPALAAEMPAMPTPGGGSAFGTHISSMTQAPDRAQMAGNFGSHVSSMARAD